MTHQDIRAACEILFVPGQTVEVRMLGKRGTASGFFDNYDTLTEKVSSFDSRGEYAGTYVTLNPVNPDLLARRANRIETRMGKDEKSAGDTDILFRQWLPVDIDPIRPSGVSSSDEEHTAARVKAFHIAEYLSDLGWPDPVVADSGNGAHLLYRIHLENDDQSRILVKGVLETLDTLFSDAENNVDTANHNSARIWKLYGTTSRKGDNIAARPHRQAAILNVPEEIQEVTREQLEHLAGMLPKEEPKQTYKDKKLGETINLAEWLSGNGIGYEQKPYSGGSLFVLDECPFSSDHKDGAYCIQFSNGAIFAGCHHNSCGSGSQRWPELREKFEGTIEERLKRLRRRPRDDDDDEDGEGASEASPRAATIARKEAKKKANSILQTGDPLRYMLDTFALDHIRDPVVAECLVMSLASRWVINAKGLHISVTGESGKGKSHAFDTLMLQVPEELKLEGRMSDKALFYIKGMKPGTVIVLDDVSLSEQMQEVLKGVTTSFKKPFLYRTVDKDRVGKTFIIPERCVWWVAKVEGTGDDQVWNRMLTCWIDDSEEQDSLVLEQTLCDAATVPGPDCGTRPELEICKEMWRSLSQVWVVVPFAEQIRFSSSMNRRNPDMLLDLVKAHAYLKQNQRERTEAGNMPVIFATVEDFTQACKLYSSLNGKSGGQESKLTRKESELVDAIRTHGRGEVTVSELQHITGMSQSVVYKMIHGTSSKGYHYSGLLEKCPAVSVCDRTLVTDENGSTIAHRREKAYSWDQYVYNSWACDGGCWLEGYDPDDHDDNPPSGGLNTSSGIAERSGKIAEFSATKQSEETGSNRENLSNNNNLCTDSGKCESMQQGISDQTSVCDHIRDLKFSATCDQGSQSDGLTSRVDESGQVNSSGKFRNLSAEGQDFPLEGDHSASTFPVSEIKPGDYIEIDKGFGQGPCDCCGYKWVNFQERMSYERMKEPPRMNRKICKKCYEIAKRAESSQFRVLPGVLNPGIITRISKDLGRCQICDNQKAVWYDPESKTAVCEICFQNLPRQLEAADAKAAD